VISVAAFIGFFVLLLIGALNRGALALAKQIAIPTLISSILCIELSGRLARRAKGRIS
jgi:hypothetical protein